MLALVECGENALHRPHAGAEIADRQAHRSRRPVRLAGDVHDPAHPLRDQVEAAAPGMGPVIAEAGELGIDEARVDLAQILEAEPGARHHRRPIILDQHVDAGGELDEQRLSLGLLVIEGDALLVAVDVAEIGVALGAVAPGAHRIALARALELDHLGPHISEDHRAERPRHVLGQVEHLQARERAVDQVSHPKSSDC